MAFVHLSSRAVIRLSGQDVISFLQGLVTCDVNKLAQAGCQFGAMLTPQGKYLHSFFLYHDAGSVLLEVAKDEAEVLMRRFAMYKLRAKVEIGHAPLSVLWSREPHAEFPHFADARLPALGFRALAPELPVVDDESAYEAYRLSLGVPESGDLMAEQDFPLQFGFEALGAVDFGKGCYVGQEVTARTKHRGRLAKVLCSIHGEAPLPAFGKVLMHEGEVAGSMRSSLGGVGLALVKAEFAGKPLTYENGRSFSSSVASWFRNALEA